MQRLNIDVTKLDKSFFFKGGKGTYADLTLMDNRDGTDQYGNDGFVVQDVGKERREAGEKGPIVGNWKYVGQKPSGIREPQGARSSEFGKAEAPRSGSQGGAAAPDNGGNEFDADDSIPFATNPGINYF